MAMRSGKEVFVNLLSNVWHANERTTKIYQELSKAAQDPQITEALEARNFVSEKVQDTLNECFRLIGEKPVPANTQMQDVFVESFKKEIAEIQGPVARKLYVLSKISHLTHFRIGQYEALVAAADMTGHFGVGVLLSTCLADKMAFAERTRHAIRRIAEERMGEKMAA